MTLTHGRLLSHGLVWEQICCSSYPKLHCSFYGASFLLEVPYWGEDSWEETLDSNFPDFNFLSISEEHDFQ